MASVQKSALPPPPRLTGEPATDQRIIMEWMAQFYSVGVLQTGLLDPSFQSNPGGAIDPDNLPDPVNTTIARAQFTANSALTAAIEAGAVADAAAARGPLLVTSFALGDASNQATLTFSAPLADTNYIAQVQASDFTGTPGAEAFIVVRVTKTTAAVVITFAAAPGAGNSITFDVNIVPIF